MVVTGENAVGLKQRNKNTVLRLLLEHSAMTKTDIASRSQLTFATVSNLVTEMRMEDLIVEMGYADSKGGRKPILYAANPNAFYFVGVDLQVEKIVIAIIDFKGSLVHSDTVSYEVEEGPFTAIKTIRALVDESLLTSNVPFSRVRGIGVSAPGPIDNKHGIIVSPPNMPGWRNVPLRDMLEDEFHVPCYLEKDANAAAFGEFRYGAGRDVNDLIYIMVDVGIGAGIVLRNEIYRGFLNGAGEIGHTSIDVDGPLCNCGKQGCLEAVASGLAIEKAVSKVTGERIHVEKLVSSEFSNYPSLTENLSKAGQYLGVAIANICNTLNPPLVILGGQVVDGSDIYFEQARENARHRILPDFAQRIQITRAKLGQLSAAVGAATIVFQEMFILNS